MTVAGEPVSVFDNLDISLSMLEPGSPFTVSLWWSKTRIGTWATLQRVALEGARVNLEIDLATQVTGVIEYREDDGGREGGMMVLSGRDTAGVLMDSDADPRISLKGLTLGDLYNKYLEAFGLEVRLMDGAGAVELRARPRALHLATSTRSSHRVHRKNLIDYWRAKPGQTVWGVLDEAARRAGYLVWTVPWPDDQPPGIGLVVDAPKDSGTSAYGFTRILNPDGTYGGNILRGKHIINGRKVPTVVTAFANNQLAAQQDARLRAEVINEGRQDRWSLPNPLPRPRFIHANEVHDLASARRAADRRIAEANGLRRVYECTVRGYANSTEPNSPLYTIDELAYVRDDFHGLDETMLIISAHFHRSRKAGDTSTIRMVPRGALQVIPETGF